MAPGESPTCAKRSHTAPVATPTPIVALRGRARCVITARTHEDPFICASRLLHEESRYGLLGGSLELITTYASPGQRNGKVVGVDVIHDGESHEPEVARADRFMVQDGKSPIRTVG